jgi:hypothetical protein
MTCLGVIGGMSISPKTESKLNSLAMVLDSEDGFANIFANKHAEEKKMTFRSK